MTTVALESDTVLSQLLTELADVFAKAEGYDDALAAAEYANEEANTLRGEVDRLQEQYAEASEETYRKSQRVALLETTVAYLVDQLSEANHELVIAYAFMREGTGPTRKNRPKLTQAEVGGIRGMVGNGSTIRSVARTYGVHPSTVSRIVSGVYHRPSDASASAGSEGEENA